ncbi:LuxR C-terminal-related transcriptional regulator [Leifsonia sp. Root4]|uniref:response regulator transcription factor n=1 Tax=Leifsonia sp. Root4 TaxID=1736525 RepID=UPI000B1BF911|nr:LuxR C-terminal-related transcriptional regulator [Leifsonia sp. Root4]
MTVPGGNGGDVRAVLVSPRALLRVAMVTILSNNTRVTVVAQAATLSGARALIAESAPDLLLLDLDIPDRLSAIERVISDVGPDAAVLGFDAPRMSEAVRVINGRPRGAVLHHDASPALLLAAVASLVETAGPRRAPAPLLTARQAQTLSLAAGGMSNAQIAEQLYISVGTVKRHLSDAFVALGARSRIDAINLARTVGQLDMA